MQRVVAGTNDNRKVLDISKITNMQRRHTKDSFNDVLNIKKTTNKQKKYIKFSEKRVEKNIKCSFVIKRNADNAPGLSKRGLSAFLFLFSSNLFIL